MEALKTLVLVVLLLAVVINAEEETNREGKCNKNAFGSRHQNQKHKLIIRKPYPLSHQDGRKFIGKKEFYPKGNEDANNQYPLPTKDQLRKPGQPFVPQQTASQDTFDDGIAFSDALVSDPVDIPSSFGISPRISISANGEISARSINFNKDNSFNDESHSHEHEHMDEDNDHFHKIRTARSAPAPTGEMKDSSTLQGVNVNNGANAGQTYNMQASGDQISSTNQAGSSASGSGTISATGSTSVTTSGGSGWR